MPLFNGRLFLWGQDFKCIPTFLSSKLTASLIELDQLVGGSTYLRYSLLCLDFQGNVELTRLRHLLSVINGAV